MTEETPESTELHEHEAWEPSWIKLLYTCLLECSEQRCKGVVVCSGTGSVDHWGSGDHEGWHEETTKFFQPAYFEPPLRIIDLPTGLPSTVAEPIQGAFKVFFASPDAAANHIRIAAEELLTSLRIRRFVVRRSKRRRVPLHDRIMLLPKKLEHVRDLLTAIKWLGNAGSHSSDSLGADDVLDAFDLLEQALNDIYDDRGSSVRATAKRINRKKGPGR